MNLKVTFFFSLGFYSWTETLWLQNFATLQGGQSQAVALAGFRAALLGTGATLDNIRITSDATLRQAYYVPSNLFPHAGNWAGQVAGITTADVAYSCVVIRCNDVNNYAKLIYLSGQPDGITITGGQVIPGTGVGVQWLTYFLAWVARLAGGAWSWRYKIPAKLGGISANIIGVSVNALPPGEIGVLVAPGAPAFQAGEEVQITGANRILGRNARQFNGLWFISSVAVVSLPTPGTIYYLRGSQGVDISQLTKLGVLNSISFGYRFISNATPEELTHRKRGVRTARPLGRSKIR